MEGKEMNHNPHNLKVGDTVIIDDGYVNGGEVTIKGFTETEMFALVECEDSVWQTMTNRLTPKLNQLKTEEK
jgi:predicted acyltransferase (DUF342 family)